MLKRKAASTVGDREKPVEHFEHVKAIAQQQMRLPRR